MRFIAEVIMKMLLQKAKNDKYDCKHTIVKQAYDNMIKNYEDTIMFINADRK
jgi:hypothetical protein